MTEHVSCPQCKGSGLVPLEDVTRGQVHASVERDEEQRARREIEAEMVRTALADREADAEERRLRLESLMYGRPRDADARRR